MWPGYENLMGKNLVRNLRNITGGCPYNRASSCYPTDIFAFGPIVGWQLKLFFIEWLAIAHMV
jgi:hypothetical protein